MRDKIYISRGLIIDALSRKNGSSISEDIIVELIQINSYFELLLKRDQDEDTDNEIIEKMDLRLKEILSTTNFKRQIK